jgi:hypothetical protein
MVKAIHTAMDARRQRIVVSQSAVGTVNLTMLMTVARTQNHILRSVFDVTPTGRDD